MLSTDDYGRDLASVQTLQRKHEGIDRDLGALQEKVRLIFSQTLPTYIVLFKYSHFFIILMEKSLEIYHIYIILY